MIYLLDSTTSPSSTPCEKTTHLQIYSALPQISNLLKAPLWNKLPLKNLSTYTSSSSGYPVQTPLWSQPIILLAQASSRIKPSPPSNRPLLNDSSVDSTTSQAPAPLRKPPRLQSTQLFHHLLTLQSYPTSSMESTTSSNAETTTYSRLCNLLESTTSPTDLTSTTTTEAPPTTYS
ncbi:flocculation protein FLO11-like [Penaeus monodon]|uniref:flocculation protein FLO11-like n=1 Tax=Penaeus monodon TaxID=6687 RepID=UPI0018A77A97|nr:flocculation protein FLO11-like [Penaeus monodon]